MMPTVKPGALAFMLFALLTPTIARAQSVASVAARRECSTAGVVGLSSQLVATQLCLRPGVFARVTPHANVTLTSSRVHPLMLASSRDALWAASRSVNLQVNSMFRSLADQYVLYHSGACGLAAQPGRSNHETGRAVDLSNWSSALGAMTRAGCAHPYPSNDAVHFDCPGGDRRADSILAFQRLWNINHPEDRIAEDGAYGPVTANRLGRSPAGGFSRGGCVVDTDGDGVPDDRDNCDRTDNRTQTDTDRDGVGDACDNCDRTDNRTQTDTDRDGVGDACDNCDRVANRDQANLDRDATGDLCDTDDDGDGVPDATDNCPRVANRDQADTNRDGMGNACDGDDDGDGVVDTRDNCPRVANTAQADADRDGVGDACDDSDGDMVVDATDNCPRAANRDQADVDRDGLGDVCDTDDDGDGVPDAMDDCRDVANADQTDTDRDGLGDACDDDDDDDGVPDDTDDCPTRADPDQVDRDMDGLGDVCDTATQPMPEPDGGMMNPDPLWDGGPNGSPSIDGGLGEALEGGCSCRAGGDAAVGSPTRGLLLAALVALTRRRRRDPRPRRRA
jgi:MYXO-CTERM domain-containing protein